MTLRGFAVVVVLIGIIALPLAQSPMPVSAAGDRPNIVVIVVDDLDSASVATMPALNREIIAPGAAFSRFFATTPLCCPSRASILRGQYAHNHGVLRNTGADAGFSTFRDSGDEGDTLATRLDAAGYETALIGKYLNGYSGAGGGEASIPPGWDYWVAGTDHQAYSGFNYVLNVNGKLVKHGHNERDYLTDVLSAQALDFLARSARSGPPFFLYLAPYAPHSPATPAPRHERLFAGATAPRTPAFNERNVADKPEWVRTTPRFSSEKEARIDEDYRRRLQSLQAVDEMIDVVVKRLDRYGVLDSTYIMVLSDNGYFLGEHRQPHGKDAPYDAAAHVPLLIRGPQIAAGSAIPGIALNIDLFPTIADFAGISVPSYVDGRSLRPLLSGRDTGWRQVALLEGFGNEEEALEASESATPAFRALRSSDTLYVKYETGERELYDLSKDPYELSNLVQKTPNPLLREYQRRLDALASCSARECEQLENLPLPLRVEGGSIQPDRPRQARALPDRRRTSRPHDRGRAQHRENRPNRAAHRDHRRPAA